jgi:hypothetical protein
MLKASNLKCEIFFCSDFQDFYTTKSFWVGDLRLKYKLFTLIFGEARSVPDAYPQCTYQFLTRMAYAQGTHQFLMRMLSMF